MSIGSHRPDKDRKCFRQSLWGIEESLTPSYNQCRKNQNVTLEFLHFAYFPLSAMLQSHKNTELHICTAPLYSQKVIAIYGITLCFFVPKCKQAHQCTGPWETLPSDSWEIRCCQHMVRHLDLTGKYYRHFKGNIYRVLHVAKHSETLEDMVVYQAMYGERGIWVRPLSMFEEEIERDGKTII